MKKLNNNTFGPEQLASIREAFDQVRSRLQKAGHPLGKGAADELATKMLKMGADGLTGNELVETAIRATLPEKRVLRERRSSSLNVDHRAAD